MKVFITGATGLIGRRLVLDRLQRGDEIIVLSRDARRASAMFATKTNSNVAIEQGDPVSPGPWQKAVDGCDAAVNLAGASISGRRWTKKYKKTLLRSRVD